MTTTTLLLLAYLLLVLVAILTGIVWYMRRRSIAAFARMNDELIDDIRRYDAGNEIYLMVGAERIQQLISDAVSENTLKSSAADELAAIGDQVSETVMAHSSEPAASSASEWFDSYHILPPGACNRGHGCC